MPREDLAHLAQSGESLHCLPGDTLDLWLSSCNDSDQIEPMNRLICVLPGQTSHPGGNAVPWLVIYIGLLCKQPLYCGCMF